MSESLLQVEQWDEIKDKAQKMLPDYWNAKLDVSDTRQWTANQDKAFLELATRIFGEGVAQTWASNMFINDIEEPAQMIADEAARAFLRQYSSDLSVLEAEIPVYADDKVMPLTTIREEEFVDLIDALNLITENDWTSYNTIGDSLRRNRVKLATDLALGNRNDIELRPL